MELRELIQFCPRCGNGAFPEKSLNAFVCARCDFHMHLNVAPAVVAIIIVHEDDADRVLLIRRARDPARGMLALPGGFMDVGETAEAALRREIDEEIELDLTSLQYFCSQPNLYVYRDVTYRVIDLFFVCRAASFDAVPAPEEVQSITLLPAEEIDLEEIAFPSMREALRLYVQARR